MTSEVFCEENGFYRETIAYIPQKVFLRGNDDYAQRKGRYPLSAMNVAMLRTWLANVGIESHLVIYRRRDRNIVLLRLGAVEVEAAWLAKLRRERLSPELVRERIARKVALCAKVC